MGSPKASVFSLVALICAILAVHLTVASSSAVDFLGGHWLPTRSEQCSSAGECLIGDDVDLVEFEMGSESTRRILAQSRYISYGALRRNTVPCSRRGASYYNCRPGAQANPYSRGCNAITRCRR